MIIGLNGRLKAGKDTTYNMIQRVMNEKNDPTPVIQVSFAKALKESAAASIGVSVAQLENWKNDESIFFTRPDGTQFTAREYLQWYGTEGHREVFGDGFWVDIALPLDKDYDDGLYVVTDMRFPNEAKQVLDAGGFTVKVVREAETKFSAHPSEQNIDDYIEYFLDNSGSLDDLQSNVEIMLANLGRRQVGLPPVKARGQVDLFPAITSLADAEDMRGWTK